MHTWVERHRLVVPLVLLLLVPACGGGGDEARAREVGGGGAPVEGVTVEGVGRARGAPDLARTTVGVNVTRPTVDEAVTESNAAAAAVLEALRGHGVDPGDIQTTQVSIHAEQQWFEDRPPTVRGYTATNLVQALLRDVEGIGEVLSAVVAAGGDATRIDQLVFEVDDDEALRADARAEAFADARRKAEQYAELAGTSLGTMTSITERAADHGPMPYALDAAVAGEGSRVPISPGLQDVEVRVQVVWSLE
jgi:hypothetical protein